MLLFLTIAAISLIIAIIFIHQKKQRFYHNKHFDKICKCCLPKPKWAKREIIRIKAHVPNAGCRLIADIFNRRFAAEKGITVGKTYVNALLCKHMSDVMEIRKRWKHSLPKYMSRNLVWGIDMTGVADAKSNAQTLFGTIDHGTRKCLSLRAIESKASAALLRILLDAIEKYGKPETIRTDNEAVFASRLFRFALWLLGIRHQRSMLHCPWQNGRIERFFGTFKTYADRVVFNARYLQKSLDEFVLWYNKVRPHRCLGGWTPDEAWNGVNPYAQPLKTCRRFSAWDGLLRGYWIRYG